MRIESKRSTTQTKIKNEKLFSFYSNIQTSVAIF